MKSKFLQKLRSFAILLSLSLFGNMSMAQTVTIGTGTPTTSYFPIYSCYVYNYAQQVYWATELNAAGASGPSFINKIRFYVSGTAQPTSTWQAWQVFLGNTTVDGIATTSSWQTGLTPVFNGNIPTISANTWMELTLPTPFFWDGISNLVVATYENSPNYYCTQSWGGYSAPAPSTPGSMRGRLFYSDPTDPGTTNPPAANYSSNTIAQIQFDMTPATPCTGSPTAGTVTPAGPLATCAGAQTVLTASGFTLAQ
ncbi:MAG TPA: hypothetical protein PLQ78_01890, partial [Flavipsychrobacter sp.]|nr:hypothetical protein [Flavipsychrobacter sp.]